jgi:hypothetical protein
VANLAITIDASQVLELMDAVEEVLNVENVLDTAAAIILNRTRRRFLEELNPQGEPWPPSQAAIKRRSTLTPTKSGKLRRGTGTLFETGMLWRSIQLAPHTGDLFGDVGERSIMAGAFNDRGTEYGHFHQFGTRMLPKREFLGINMDDVELFEHRILQQVAEKLGL